MRWYILRTLLIKEAHRHLADRGGIFLALLLIGASLLMSLFGRSDAQEKQFFGGVQLCYLDYGEDSPWIRHLIENLPAPELKIKPRSERSVVRNEQGIIVYPENTGAIQIHTDGADSAGRPRYLINFWFPGKDPRVLDPYAEWFWKESLRYYQSAAQPVEVETAQGQIICPDEQTIIRVRPGGPTKDGRPRHKFLYRRPGKEVNLMGWVRDIGGHVGMSPKPPVEIEVESRELEGRADERSMLATAFVIFALCFFSVYLMPALTCEERERGLLLAQVLSPASPREILAAKFLFYPLIGMALGALLAGIYSPRVLVRPFFWLGLIATAAGYLGVGVSIASLARTQRRASMGAMFYMLSIALLLFITGRFGIPGIQYLTLEFHCPRIVHAALVDNTPPERLSLLVAVILALFWIMLSSYLFRKCGWQ